MIVVDKATEQRLYLALAEARDQKDALRCLWIHPPTPEMPVAALVALIEQTLETTDLTLYVCADQDLFILGNYLPTKSLHLLAQACTTANLPMPLFEYFEAGTSWVRLQQKVRGKLEQVQADDERQKKLAEAQAKERERQAILNVEIEPLLLSTMADRRLRHTRTEILVIEDEDFTRSLVDALLKKDNSVSSLRQGTHALTHYAIKAPHIVFLDINLPDVSGHDLLKKIMAMDPDAYVVMLSGSGDRANVLRAVEAGARGFIGKPFTREKLLHYISKCPTTPANTTQQKEKLT